VQHIRQLTSERGLRVELGGIWRLRADRVVLASVTSKALSLETTADERMSCCKETEALRTPSVTC
jgi:hypothetical protein